MRIVLRILEYIWYPLFLSLVVFTACKLGAFDTGTGQATAGAMILGIMIWKYCALILKETTTMQICLVLCFLWAITVFAVTPAGYTPDQIVKIAMYPGALFAKQAIWRTTPVNESLLRALMKLRSKLSRRLSK